MKNTTNPPNDNKIRPGIWMMVVGLIGVALIVGIFGLHSHWFDRYDSGADKPLTSITVTNAGQPKVPAGFVQEAPQEVQLASAETETPVVSNQVVVTNNTFKVELEFEFQKGQRAPKQQ